MADYHHLRKAGDSPSAGRTELAGPRQVLGLFPQGFCESGECAASGESAPGHRKRRFPERLELETIPGSDLNIFLAERLEAGAPTICMPGRRTFVLRSEPHFCPLRPAAREPRIGVDRGPGRNEAPAPDLPGLLRLLRSGPRVLPGRVLAPVERYAFRAPQP
ncbi:hypothetical protein H8959_008525 [Pygathrix nigripes]